MAKTYEQIQRQISDLQAEAEKLRRKELDGVVSRIREAIDFYKLTASDLGFGGKAPASAQTAAAPAKKTAARKFNPSTVSYTNGAGGHWGGRGKRPQWLRDALLAGKTLEDYKVKAT